MSLCKDLPELLMRAQSVLCCEVFDVQPSGHAMRGHFSYSVEYFAVNPCIVPERDNTRMKTGDHAVPTLCS